MLRDAISMAFPAWAYPLDSKVPICFFRNFISVESKTKEILGGTPGPGRGLLSMQLGIQNSASVNTKPQSFLASLPRWACFLISGTDEQSLWGTADGKGASGP